MVHHQKIHCPHCQGTDLQKNGKCHTGVQRWSCKTCKRYFRLAYRYNACKEGVKEKIIEMTLNSSGVRDIGRVLSISKDTVTSVLKKTPKANPFFLTKDEINKLYDLEIEIRLTGEMDEFWSFVQNKSSQRWTVVRHRAKFRHYTGLAQREKTG